MTRTARCPTLSAIMCPKETEMYLWYAREAYPYTRRDDLDQCRATVQTVVRRVTLLGKEGAFDNKTILLMGDDDLLSLAILHAHPEARIMVIDKDAELLSYILGMNTNLGCINYDVRSPLPSELVNAYDVVFTDPPYTTAGQELFLRRAVRAMKPKNGSVLYMCGSVLYLDEAKIMGIISLAECFGLKLEHCYSGFNDYELLDDVARDMVLAGKDPKKEPFSSNLYKYVAEWTIGDRIEDDASIEDLDIYNYGHTNG